MNTLYRFPGTFRQIPSLGSQFAVEHEFTHHWHAEGDFNYGANWDQIRVENINAPMLASSTGAAPDPIAAQFGLLTINTVNGNVQRNLGTMPGVVHLDTNLSRSFALPGSKENPRTLTFSARSANLLNHTNVTAVNTILSSGAVGQPLTADTARRIELGARFTF